MPPRLKLSSMRCRRRRRGRSSAARSWSAPGGRRGPTLAAQRWLPVRWKIVAGPSGFSRKARRPTASSPGRRTCHRASTGCKLMDASLATEDVPLIAAPERAFGGDFDRCWLLAVQLYSVRSARNWGIGDFTDLARPDRTCPPSRRRRRRPQSAARAVRRSSRRLQSVFAEQPAVSQCALCRSREDSGVSPGRHDAGCAGAGEGR